MEKIIVAVGSTRRPKLDAVTEALVSIQSAFGVDKTAPEMEFEVVGFEVPSGVRHTPPARASAPKRWCRSPVPKINRGNIS